MSLSNTDIANDVQQKFGYVVISSIERKVGDLVPKHSGYNTPPLRIVKICSLDEYEEQSKYVLSKFPVDYLPPNFPYFYGVVAAD